MKKSERKKKSRKKILDFPQANLIWGALAICAWLGEQGWHIHQGEAFSLILFLKGVLLLALCFGLLFLGFQGLFLFGLFSPSLADGFQVPVGHLCQR
jgi:hypothetical protein